MQYKKFENGSGNGPFSWIRKKNFLTDLKIFGFLFREPVSTSADSLDPRHVFLVDGGLKIFVWYGRKCKNLLKSKARLMAEKINKIERKDKVRKHEFEFLLAEIAP